jgi:hypothetical protein
MRKLLSSLVIAGALVQGTIVGALAAAPPDFPEQPGTHVATACTAVMTGPGQGLEHAAVPAVVITTRILVDACYP